jgi:hypothetical protein
MRSPFPGMDPYLEDPIEWPDVYHQLITEIRRLLVKRVTPHFIVRVEQRVTLVDLADDERRVIIPDAYLAEAPDASRYSTASATISASRVIAVLEDPEVHEHYIDIYDARQRNIVATLELLSPANKTAGPSRTAFLNKRRAVMASPAHWIEIDLLRDGERPREVAGLSDYYVLLKRGATGERGEQLREAWFADIRDRLPTIAVPLRPPFADVPLDLQAALDAAYAEARYADHVRYDTPPPPPALKPADDIWARAQVDAWRRQFQLP